MNKLILVSLGLMLVGCTGAQLQNEWKSERGYSDAEMAEIRAQYSTYQKEHIGGGIASNRFNSAPQQEVEARFKSIFCNCVKKLGDRCRKKPEGLTGSDRALWAKANAIDMVFASQHTALDMTPARKIDADECS